VQVELTAQGLGVNVAPATPQPCYVLSAFGGQVLSDDLRFCATLTGAALDPVGTYALLLFGQSPPPLTCLQGVSRLAGGYRYCIERHGITATRDFIPNAAPTTDVRLAEARVGTVLDRLIAATPRHAVLFFSGGVDSSLLAARAAALGRHDIQLLNYAFGAEDPEAAHALRVASHLHLACDRITHDASHSAQVLERIGRDYGYPFGDLSTLPTNLLVHAAFGSSSTLPAVIEGTGADGAFGVAASYGRWRSVFAVPAPLRLAGRAAYDWLRLWRFNFHLERVLRFVRKSTRLGIAPAVLAHHSLDGIAFDLPAGVRAELPVPNETQLTPEERLSLLDLAWVCAGRMAPKTFDPLRSRGIQPIYPYLEPDLIRMSSSVAWSVKSAKGEEKSLLKTLLARELPKPLVYRKKSGFTPPYRTTLATASLQAFLHDVVLSRANPVLEWCDVGTVRDLVERAGSGAEVSAGAVDFLWTLAFTSGWLRQLPPAVRIANRSVA
jgi:asparagine synthase (glutamine-hydrolysing)